MKKSKPLSFPLIIIAIILGSTIYKQFNFETLRFVKPAMAIVYIIGFAIAVYLLFSNRNGQPKDKA
ncbi:MAG: hypothetical protein RL172_1991 [Bacteroidota bacterium]|jgi:predicted ferric reductase